MNLGFTQIALFDGIVQGVVVQIMNEASSSTTPLPSRTLKATKIEGDLISLYSTSASARVDSEDGDQ